MCDLGYGIKLPTCFNKYFDDFRIDYLENVSRSFTHYKSHWDLKTHFTGTNTSVCMIQKNGHAAIQYVSCLLTYKEYEIDKQYRRLESMAIFAGAFDNLCQFTVIRKKPGSANFKRVVFIRDPLERFISGWLFLCKRYGSLLLIYVLIRFAL